MDLVYKISYIKQFNIVDDVIKIIIKNLVDDLIQDAFEIIDINNSWELESAYDSYSYWQNIDIRTIIHGFNFIKLMVKPNLYITLEGPCTLKDYYDALYLVTDYYQYRTFNNYIIYDWST
jgi:hypothetical protein